MLHELSYELALRGHLTPVMPVEAFDEDVASIASDTRRNQLPGGGGCPILVIRALRGIGGDPLAQMLDDATIEAARSRGPDAARRRHRRVHARAARALAVREQVASEILAVAP